MKVKRLKRAARVLTFFRYNFAYVPPYSILLDGTFCQAALQNKINLREQMPKYLGESAVEMFVTECVLNELEQLGKPLHGAHVIAQQFRIAKCPHRPMRTAAECIAHLARRSKRTKKEEWENGEKNGGSKNAAAKYFVATQDDSLLEKLRELGGIPLMSIRFNTILLEKPSDQSQLEVERKNPTDELEKARQLKRMELGEVDGGKRHRKRKAKGPNPLSCKKKKKEPPPQMNSTGNGATKGGVAGAFGNQRMRKSDGKDRTNSFLGGEKQNKESEENAKKKRMKRRKMLETGNNLENSTG